MNHSRTNPPIAYCPTCGERFKTTAARSCNTEKHREQRKSGSTFCSDCGKNLKTA